ncbi:single-stranded DNA-binding protein [Mesoplasma florum L1]|uniref:Single-stranded DNA-binding protein n=1 Tax=Mesoplasma florum (strain ATCC 33453 / NBRC 100688 / NCTC 11704 / L1) TaxID=265311 RepID=Q6F236_MESFL|nr:single-stranded DNA-binding protein [Mesoplasma florum]AAT75437.1 single-stranded DNA-binding protein [Mesoplasma florum L1]ATI73039.1 single-stranded DNA-binding protein [Mesoplasma florum]ATI73727.1 single-stranded DNA-binding protein [Mesoplasma florum]AVN60765.1 single-stranded DNA-binding protein [Mesoplasma florum]AVN61442.1 single-stranded DNA-binding protein [Mesoplasma florum]
MNQVCLIGRITKDIELRNTTNGQGKFVSFTLAVSEYSGQKEITNFIPCFAFNNTAENMARFLSKGSLISVSGRVNVRTSQTDGKYETIVTITADRVNFLESAKNRGSNNSVETNSSINLDSPMQNKTSSIASNNVQTEEIILSEDESILWD